MYIAVSVGKELWIALLLELDLRVPRLLGVPKAGEVLQS